MPQGRKIPVSDSRFQVSKRGFTMVELVVVLAIIVVLATISIPTIESMTSPKHALRRQGRKVMQLMAEARTAAMTRKVKVSLYIDPKTREIRMIEEQAHQAAASEDDTVLFDSKADTNSYEKVVLLKEEFELDSFTAAEIEHTDDDEDPFQKKDRLFGSDRDEPKEQLAVVFTQFGGSNGGGVSLMKEGVQLALAADILTGRPKIVKREVKE